MDTNTHGQSYLEGQTSKHSSKKLKICLGTCGNTQYALQSQAEALMSLYMLDR